MLTCLLESAELLYLPGKRESQSSSRLERAASLTSLLSLNGSAVFNLRYGVIFLSFSNKHLSVQLIQSSLLELLSAHSPSPLLQLSNYTYLIASYFLTSYLSFTGKSYFPSQRGDTIRYGKYQYAKEIKIALSSSVTSVQWPARDSKSIFFHRRRVRRKPTKSESNKSYDLLINNILITELRSWSYWLYSVKGLSSWTRSGAGNKENLSSKAVHIRLPSKSTIRPELYHPSLSLQSRTSCL